MNCQRDIEKKIPYLIYSILGLAILAVLVCSVGFTWKPTVKHQVEIKPIEKIDAEQMGEKAGSIGVKFGKGMVKGIKDEIFKKKE